MHVSLGSDASRRPLWAVALVLALGACEGPGVRSVGRGHVMLVGGEPVSWQGSCSYEVSTPWETRLSHGITLEDDSSGLSLRISMRRAPKPGRYPVRRPTDGNEDIMALLMDGNTIDGAAEGELAVSVSRDSLTVELTGNVTQRETYSIGAVCRMGPPDPGPGP